MKEIVEFALGAFREAGIEGEIYLEQSTGTTISVHEGKIESLVQRAARGAGLRVFVEGRTAFAFTADLGREGLRRTIETARAIAPHAKRDDANRLEPLPERVPAMTNYDEGIARVPIDEKMEMARTVERAARDTSAKVRKVRGALYQDSASTVTIANSTGGRVSFDSSRCYAGIELAATEGDSSQTGSCVGWALGPQGLDPAAVGAEAARRAERKLGASQPATGRTTIVLDPEAAANLLDALAPLFCADAVLKGTSLLAGKDGEVVASASVHLIDDGGIAGGYSSAPVDGEGTPTGETVLVEGGRLRAFFQSGFTARKMGVARTGNGVRGSYGGTPDPSPTNLFLRPTGITREALLGSVASGIYVTDWMGLHTINTITGEFSLGASGLAIENGALGGGLDRMAISGNVIDLMKSIEAVATDLVFLVSGGGATVLLRDISVGGA